MSKKNIINIKNVVNSDTDIYSDLEIDLKNKMVGGNDDEETDKETEKETDGETKKETEEENDDNENNKKNINITETIKKIQNENMSQEQINGDVDPKSIADDIEGIESGISGSNFTVSQMKTITIKKNQILYHASYKRDTFDPIKINLNKGKKYLSAYFSTNKKFASSRIKDCTKYPQGYIHAFEVKMDIDNIYLLSQYDLSEWNLEMIEKNYCNATNIDGDKYNGIGFYIMKGKTDNSVESSEFALCNPKRYLKYLHTIKCKSYGEFSGEYRFDEKNKIQ